MHRVEGQIMQYEDAIIKESRQRMLVVTKGALGLKKRPGVDFFAKATFSWTN